LPCQNRRKKILNDKGRPFSALMVAHTGKTDLGNTQNKRQGRNTPASMFFLASGWVRSRERYRWRQWSQDSVFGGTWNC
jgi:hypothetical protein